MKFAILLLALAAPFCWAIGNAGSVEPVPVRVETDHGGDPSDVSTDELVLRKSDGTKEFLTKNRIMERVPTLSFDGSLLAFLRRNDSNKDGKVNWDDEVELWTMSMKDRTESRLAETLTDPSFATWHPSKLQFAFIATDHQKGRRLYTYDLLSKALVPVADKARSWPAWSPDGNFLAFYDRLNRIVLYEVSRESRTVLSGDVGNGWALYWTDGNRLIFTEESIGWQIYAPGEAKAAKIDESDRKQLKLIDQEEFGWASRAAK